MLVHDIVRRNAVFFGDADAVVVPGGVTRTWKEVDERSTRIANALHDLGLGKGERLVMYAPNCAEYIDFFFACAKSGVIGAATNVRIGPDDVVAYLATVEPVAVLVHAAVSAQARAWLERLPTIEHIIGFGGEHGFDLDLETLLASASDAEPDVEIDENDIYQLGATSGTTGVPKGAILTHRNALAAMTSWAADIPCPERGTALQNIPLFFNPGGPAGLHPVLMKGGRTVIAPGFDPREFPRLVEEYQVTNTVIVPTMAHMVAGSPGAQDHDMSSLRSLVFGGSPLSPELLRRIRPIFGDIFHPIYGMAETYSTGAVLRPENQFTEGTPEELSRLASIGKPGVLTNLRVVDESGADVPHDGETSGEVWLSGDTVSPGYFRMDSETAASREGEWFRSGDVAVVSPGGFLTLVDRLKDVIITGGINVFSVEVERVIEQLDGVEQVAVIGVPHPQWGEAIHAIVRPRPGAELDEASILAFAGERLTGYKKPRSAEVVEEMPVNATGKILKRALRTKYREGS